MEPFFSHPLPRYHADAAAITQLRGSEEWPPKVIAFGLARSVRFWRGADVQKKPEFVPVASAQSVDGQRCVAAAFLGASNDRLVTVDASSQGKVHIWSCPSSDDGKWGIQETLLCGSEAACLAVVGDYVAVSTTDGRLLVWRGAGGAHFQPAAGFASGARQLDTWALTLMAGGVGSKGEPLLAVVLPGKRSIATVHMEKGAVMYTGLQVELDSGQKLPCLNVRHSILLHGSLACVSWDPGHDAQVSIMALDGSGGGLLESDERLRSHGEPLCCAFDGRTLAVGFADGAISGFGVKGFLRWHGGAVGAVGVVSERDVVVSAAADGSCCMWDRGGTLVGRVDYPDGVSALYTTPLYSLVGLETGAWDLLVHATAEDVHTAASRPSPEAEHAAVTLPAKMKGYDYAFDSRWKGEGCASTRAASLAEFWRFVPQLSLPAPPEPASDLAGPAGNASQRSEADAAKGSTGTTRHDSESPPKDLEASRAAMRKLEGGGVARSTSPTHLPSATAALGRKCDSLTCLVHEGVGRAPFKRCGACRQAWYCSVHCQTTHWRNGHSAACGELKRKAADASCARAAIPAVEITTRDAEEPKIEASEVDLAGVRAAPDGVSCDDPMRPSSRDSALAGGEEPGFNDREDACASALRVKGPDGPAVVCCGGTTTAQAGAKSVCANPNLECGAMHIETCASQVKCCANAQADGSAGRDDSLMYELD